jgi:hypothetical protein
MTNEKERITPDWPAILFQGFRKLILPRTRRKAALTERTDSAVIATLRRRQISTQNIAPIAEIQTPSTSKNEDVGLFQRSQPLSSITDQLCFRKTRTESPCHLSQYLPQRFMPVHHLPPKSFLQLPTVQTRVCWPGRRSRIFRRRYRLDLSEPLSRLPLLLQA